MIKRPYNNCMNDTTVNPVNPIEEFSNAYEELLTAYKASGDPMYAPARMVGALKVIISFDADPHSLAVISKSLRDSAKRETLKILSKETG